MWIGELYLELHRGTLTTQGRTKRAHRRAERDLVAAEALSGLSALAGGDPEGESLEPLWRVLLRNEFHDILPGSAIREVYEDAERELGDGDRRRGRGDRRAAGRARRAAGGRAPATTRCWSSTPTSRRGRCASTGPSGPLTGARVGRRGSRRRW